MDDDSLQAQLELLVPRAKARQLSVAESAAMYELIGELRERARYFERELIRSLRYTTDTRSTRKVRYRWREVAEAVGVAGRQGAYQRWQRLLSPAPDEDVQ